MPLYDDRFAGHMETDDPRTPLHGAAGCIWPTVPAWHLQVKSDDATGIFAVWNVTPALLVRLRTQPDHDFYEYFPTSVPPPWAITRAVKVWNPSTGGYRWELDMNAGSGICAVEFRVEFPEQKCNVTHVLGNKECPGSVPAGASGETFRLIQVEWDETNPP